MWPSETCVHSKLSSELNQPVSCAFLTWQPIEEECIGCVGIGGGGVNVCVLFTKALVMALLLIKLAEKTERIFGCFPLRKAFCTRDFILFFFFCPQNYILIHTEWRSCSHSDSEIVNSLHGCVCLPVCVCVSTAVQHEVCTQEPAACDCQSYDPFRNSWASSTAIIASPPSPTASFSPPLPPCVCLSLSCSSTLLHLNNFLYLNSKKKNSIDPSHDTGKPTKKIA